MEQLLGQAEALLRSGGQTSAANAPSQLWPARATEWPGGGDEEVGAALAETVCLLASHAAQRLPHGGETRGDEVEAVTILPLACAALHAYCSYASAPMAPSAAGRALQRQNRILQAVAALCTRVVASAHRAGPVRTPLALRPLCALACEAVSTQEAARGAMKGAPASCPPARLAVALDPRLAQCLGGGWRVYGEIAVTCSTALLHCAHACPGAPAVLAGVGRRAPAPAEQASGSRRQLAEALENAELEPLPDSWRREGQLLVPRVSVALHVMARLLAGDGVSWGGLGDRLSLFDNPAPSLPRSGWPERVPSGPQSSEGGESGASPPPSSVPEVFGHGGRERGGGAAAQQSAGRRAAPPTESAPWDGLLPPPPPEASGGGGGDRDQGGGDGGVRNALAEACSLLVLLLAALAADSGAALTAQARATCVADDLSAACTTLAALRVLDHHNAGTDASGGTQEWQPLWEVCDAIRAEDLGTV